MSATSLSDNVGIGYKEMFLHNFSVVPDLMYKDLVVLKALIKPSPKLVRTNQPFQRVK